MLLKEFLPQHEVVVRNNRDSNLILQIKGAFHYQTLFVGIDVLEPADDEICKFLRVHLTES
jgi:hypothetical protein